MMNKSRTKELAKIHIAAKQLGLEGETYRNMLWVVARVRSSKDLDDYGRKQVIAHLKKCGASFTQKRRTRPAEEKASQVSKIRALLINDQRPDTYADAMSQRMFTVDRFEWCTTEQLGKIIAALVYDAKRHGGKTE